MKSEKEVIKLIVNNEMLLKGYQDRVNQSKEDEDVDYLLDEINNINLVLGTLYGLFK